MTKCCHFDRASLRITQLRITALMVEIDFFAILFGFCFISLFWSAGEKVVPQNNLLEIVAIVTQFSTNERWSQTNKKWLKNTCEIFSYFKRTFSKIFLCLFSDALKLPLRMEMLLMLLRDPTCWYLLCTKTP